MGSQNDVGRCRGRNSPRGSGHPPPHERRAAANQWCPDLSELPGPISGQQRTCPENPGLFLVSEFYFSKLPGPISGQHRTCPENPGPFLVSEFLLLQTTRTDIRTTSNLSRKSRYFFSFRIFTSPNYPDRYPDNIKLVQKIQVLEGNTIIDFQKGLPKVSKKVSKTFPKNI